MHHTRTVRKMRVDGQPPEALPDNCPFTLDEWLSGDTDELVGRLSSQS